ncbi:hypothetical protein PtB15_3B229 [Puccinia triticina]|nr:hypothetical protein PtB15_3B229 [Puccinia triticina]
MTTQSRQANNPRFKLPLPTSNSAGSSAQPRLLWTTITAAGRIAKHITHRRPRQTASANPKPATRRVVDSTIDYSHLDPSLPIDYHIIKFLPDPGGYGFPPTPHFNQESFLAVPGHLDVQRGSRRQFEVPEAVKAGDLSP